MGKTALSIGADTFAFFTRNPRGSKARETDPRDVEKFQALWETDRAIPLVPMPLYPEPGFHQRGCADLCPGDHRR